MRIAFTVIGNSRRGNYLNGDNIRYAKAGASGTDTSAILVCEYLSKCGYEVVFAMDRLEKNIEQELKVRGDSFVPGTEVRGVQYTYMDFTGISNLEFDILVNMLWFQDYETLPIKVTKAVIYWSHMQWIYGLSNLVEYTNKNKLNVGVVHISEWEKSLTNIVVESIRNQSMNKTHSSIIPNPIMDDIIEEVASRNIIKNPHKFIFHASWARGGDIAMQAIKSLNFPDKQLHAFDYLMTIPDYKEPFFVKHDSVDKMTLFTHIAESEYFVYPLYTPYQDVHKDTFSCVVAEAISLGTTVITYPLGALRENFEDYCCWLEFPDQVIPEKIQKEPLTKDIEGRFKITNNIIDKISFLEQNSDLKNKVKEEGKKYIIYNFNINKVGAMWIEFINNILD
jgi:glycosyltransferase involved in cell wall biosynthesis